MDSNTILVVMPVYNAEKTLKKAIDSVLSQTYANLHLVIVDDKSTDSSLEIAKEYNNNRRVTLIANKENEGAYYSRNIGLYKFRNQQWGFFTTHDADDVSVPNRFELLHRHFNNKRTNGVQDTWERRYLSNNKSIKVALTCAHAMFTRQVFNDLGYFDMMRFGADWEYWARLNRSNKPKNLITRGMTQTMGTSYMAKGNLTEQIPEDSPTRAAYIQVARREHEAMDTSKTGYYRGFTPKSKAKRFRGVKDPVVRKEAVTARKELNSKVGAGTETKKSTRKYNNVRITVVLLTWRRIGNLKKTLAMLSGQSFQNFEVFISNGNLSQKQNVESYAKLFSDRLKIRVSHDGNEMHAFRRFTVGERLASEGTDIVLFIDDDITFPSDYLESCLRYYEPKSYKSHFAWSFQDNGSDYYGKRTRIRDFTSKIHYCGTGVSMIDASIFLDRGLINKAPKEALLIEDLWLSYYAQQVKKWKLGYLDPVNVIIGGADSVALYKQVLNDKQTKAGAVDKADFLRLLVKKYKWKL